MNIDEVDELMKKMNCSQAIIWEQINIFTTLFLLEVTGVYVVKKLKDVTPQNDHNPVTIPFTYRYTAASILTIFSH